MSPEDQIAAFAATAKAIERRASATELERDLIDALAMRYSAQPVEDRDPLDRAYATALGELTRKYPADDDIAAMFAEAWMNTMPWDYWSDDGSPRPEIVPVIAALETIIARNPRHPLALHLYIHAVEASSNPARGEDEADTLAGLVPGSGHLVHMPAHICTGGSAAITMRPRPTSARPRSMRPTSRNATRRASIRRCTTRTTSISCGRPRAWRAAARSRSRLRARWPRTCGSSRSSSFRRWSSSTRSRCSRSCNSAAGTRSSPSRAARGSRLSPTASGITRAASRFANKGDVERARAEASALVPLKANDKVHLPRRRRLSRERAARDRRGARCSAKSRWPRDDPQAAIAHFERAVAGQDALPYTEPPFWYYPTRQSLGLALLRAGRAADAEAVYRKDLQAYPHNGWSTFGLIQSLEAQGKIDDAASTAGTSRRCGRRPTWR